MHVRLLTEADAEAYRGLRVKSVDEAPDLTGPEVMRELSMYAKARAGVLSCYGAEGTRVWGAFDEGMLVGVVATTRSLERRDHGRVRLWGLYVRPEYRGTVAPQCLMRAAIDWGARQPDVAVIVLHVGRGGWRARRLFHRFGFEMVADEEACVGQHRAMRLQLGKSRHHTVGNIPSGTSYGGYASPS